MNLKKTRETKCHHYSVAACTCDSCVIKIWSPNYSQTREHPRACTAEIVIKITIYGHDTISICLACIRWLVCVTGGDVTDAKFSEKTSWPAVRPAARRASVESAVLYCCGASDCRWWRVTVASARGFAWPAPNGCCHRLAASGSAVGAASSAEWRKICPGSEKERKTPVSVCCVQDCKEAFQSNAMKYFKCDWIISSMHPTRKIRQCYKIFDVVHKSCERPPVVGATSLIRGS